MHTADTVETVSGTLFYRAPDRLVVVVERPVSQWIVFESTGVLFWYPDERKGWRLVEKARLPTGLPSLFVAIPKADCGLAAAGFSLEGTEIRDDLLRTKWQPPRSLQQVISQVAVDTREDLPLVLQVWDRRGKLWVKLSYSYVVVGDMTLPVRVELRQLVKKAYVTEEIVYSGHVMNGDLPAGIADFQLPQDATVKEIRQ